MGFGMVELASWLASLPIGRALRQLNWLVPWLQTIHILANGIVLSAVVMIGMRWLLFPTGFVRTGRCWSCVARTSLEQVDELGIG